MGAQVHMESGGLSAGAEAALQRLIDSLTHTTNRMGGFDDERLRLVIYGTSPTAPIADDAVHYHSALHRTATREVFDWVDSWLRANKVNKARHPQRLPANPRLAMVSRLCMPIRHGEALLGYLWVIDPDEDLSTAHQELMVRIAEAAGSILAEDRQRLESRQAIAANLLDELLVGNPGERHRAVENLIKEGLFASDSKAVAVIVRYRAPTDMDTRWAIDALGAAAQDFVDTLSPALAIRHTAPEATLIVVSPLDPILRDVDPVPAGLGALVLQTIEKDRLPVGCIEVGVSRPYSLLELASAKLEADRALQVGRALHPEQRVFGWSDLGVYKLIGRFPTERLRVDDLSPGLTELLKEERREYRDTIETYLDQAGDVASTAAILGIHRATVYYRLHRIEQFLETDLTDGEALLELHLGLKLARIAGPA